MLRRFCQSEDDFQTLKQALLQNLPQAAPGRSPSQALQTALLTAIARIRESLDLNEIFQTTAIEVRQLLQADRVGVFRFDETSQWTRGTFVSESVDPAYESAIAAQIDDHCFGEHYASHYFQGRVFTIDDIQRAELSPCHIDILSRFSVQASLVAPLIQGEHLWGLLCVHQCGGPRRWEPTEVEWVTHIAKHLSVALYQAELLHQVQTQARQQDALFALISKIRESLDLDTIFNITTTEVRRLLEADRVGILRFNPGSGWEDSIFIAETVQAQFGSALACHVRDHCFGDHYVQQYEQGKVYAVDDIYQAGLSPCHIAILEEFQIRANLIAPLMKGDRLWGMLCVHQCSAPRHWHANDVDFVRHIATHLSVAIQQAELLDQTRQQSAELADALQHLQHSQAQLIQQEKMSSLGQLVAGVAHEINNPVNFIYGNINHANQYAHDLLELLKCYQRRYPDAHPDIVQCSQGIDVEFLQKDFPAILHSMQVGAERIRNIVLSLRNFSRLDEADMKLVDIHEGIESTLLILQYRLKPKRNTSEIHVVRDYGDLPLVECYPSQLNQVFMNILSNAIDALEPVPHSPSGTSETEKPCKQIVIQTMRLPGVTGDRDRALIRIVDNGAGVPEAIWQKLFDPFFTTKPIGHGTGLGLSISYQIVVDRHHGTLQCLSEVGKGTEFRIEIPVRQRTSTSTAHSGPT